MTVYISKGRTLNKYSKFSQKFLKDVKYSWEFCPPYSVTARASRQNVSKDIEDIKTLSTYLT